ncbi:MAG: Gfo/Idh/MocA family oxidoreductase [Anaerolineae bacterium]|nr:Gfo/Idh/MocA family oxidoreductase [Anaerolineae bacterium]
MKDKIKLAVIGLGNMGIPHTNDIQQIPNAKLAAVCDIIPEKAKQAGTKLGVPFFTNAQECINSPEIDGLVIATPHYFHTPIAIEAMMNGKHVLTEKPIAVHAADAQKMIAAYYKAAEKFPKLVFAAMFQQRTLGYWRKVKDLIASGELGKLIRTTWIITDWFRTQYYYDMGGWRATWQGEGGGVLLNQCPHNLDLYQWLVGMPAKVWGFTGIGKYHHIEVEDEVTGYFEHENGMVGHFITTTAESPGSNRLEIVGENGKLVCENNSILFYRNRTSMLDAIHQSKKAFDKVENWPITIPYPADTGHPHRDILQNFVNAIQVNETLIAPAPEGIHSVSLGNAILYSSFQEKPVRMPIDANAYETFLNGLCEKSVFTKNSSQNQGPTDMTGSFTR